MMKKRTERSSSEITVYSLMRAMAGIESGRHCRSCHEPIDRHDRFGMSEAVCSACRVRAA